MIKHVFCGTFILTAAEELSEQQWKLSGTFSDRVGVYNATHLEVNDLVFVDTRLLEPNTITVYRISEIHESNWTGSFEITARYLLTNPNLTPNPALSWALNSQGLITRASVNTGLIPIYSSQEQAFSDTFSVRIQNYNTLVTLDDKLSESENESGDSRSAYEIAIDNGFSGTEQEWLESLNGKSAYEIAVDNGFSGTEADWVQVLYDGSASGEDVLSDAAIYFGELGANGKSAYEIAVDNGFTGSEQEWLDSLKSGGDGSGGGDGADGKSAYEIAVDNGFSGTETEWLESLTGKSAYEIALENGFTGSEAEWLDSLKASEGTWLDGGWIDGEGDSEGGNSDGLGGGINDVEYGLITCRLDLVEPGHAQLPTRPYGGTVYNQGQLHLNNGSVLDLTGVTLSYFDDNWWAVIEPNDYTDYEAMIDSLSVSFLCDLKQLPEG